MTFQTKVLAVGLKGGDISELELDNALDTEVEEGQKTKRQQVRVLQLWTDRLERKRGSLNTVGSDWWTELSDGEPRNRRFRWVSDGELQSTSVGGQQDFRATLSDQDFNFGSRKGRKTMSSHGILKDQESGRDLIITTERDQSQTSRTGDLMLIPELWATSILKILLLKVSTCSG